MKDNGSMVNFRESELITGRVEKNITGSILMA